MARITVEDCLENVRNRFELVHVASRRVRQLMKGARPLVDNTFSQNRLIVVSLREVAAGCVRPQRDDSEVQA
ncbi:MAG: DNA-directed RNA polymerase subunit omega [Bdellovibrionota bacterium]